MTLALATRVITRGLRLGLGDMPTPNLYVMVTLCGDSGSRKAWGIARNKNGLDERRKEELSHAIAKHVAPLIEKAAQMGVEVQLDCVNDRLAGILDLANAAAKRERRASPAVLGGARQGGDGGTGRKRRTAADTQDKPGNVLGSEKARARGIRIQLDDRLPGDPLLTDHGGNIIGINRAHQAYQTFGPTGTDWGLLVLVFFAANRVLSGQQLLPYDPLVKEQIETQADELQHAVSILIDSYVRLNNPTADEEATK